MRSRSPEKVCAKFGGRARRPPLRLIHLINSEIKFRAEGTHYFLPLHYYLLLYSAGGRDALPYDIKSTAEAVLFVIYIPLSVP